MLRINGYKQADKGEQLSLYLLGVRVVIFFGVDGERLNRWRYYGCFFFFRIGEIVRRVQRYRYWIIILYVDLYISFKFIIWNVEMENIVLRVLIFEIKMIFLLG